MKHTSYYLELNYNAKDMGTFRSARWRKDYTPELSITSRNTLDGPTIATRHILGDFSHSQHRPVLLEYGLKVPLIRSLPKPRWNFRKAKWVEYANELDHRMGAVNQGSMKQHTINPNQVATRLTGMSKLAMDKEHARIIKSELRHRKKTLEPHTSLGADFSPEEINNALRKTKINKAAGSGQLPKLFKRAKVIALLKPGKDGLDAADFRPISLLSVPFKLLERIILERIQPHIDKLIPVGQAGFRENRGCFYGLQRKQMAHSKQWSPARFSSCTNPIHLYLHDIPKTKGLMFQYADDIAIVHQSRELKDGSNTLNDDLATLGDYFYKWRLKPNPTKTEVCAFHLNNKQAYEELEVVFNGVQVQHSFKPKYLGITLYRSLSFKEHIEKTTKKLHSRINIIQKLAGTGWGADGRTLRTATLALVYSTAEYGAQSTAKELALSNFEGTKEWCENWTSTDVKNSGLVPDPNKGVVGMDLPRDVWSVLNRIRTGHGRCGSMMSKWGLKDSPTCDCGHDNQTIHHIVEDCPKRRFNRGIEGIHAASNEALEWIRELDIAL
ncbi:hypothetical protein QTP88_012127 [Uroleucon formosanum]